MKKVKVSLGMINKYKRALLDEEKSEATIKKYVRDIVKFYEYLPESKMIDKEIILQYKYSLQGKYKISSINSMLVAMNRFLDFIDMGKMKVKLHKIQKRLFSDQTKELTKNEYMRLLTTAKNHHDNRLYMLIQTLCVTGIRVSEHGSITVEALRRGKTVINNKGKIREIYFDHKFSRMLLEYCKDNRIAAGSVFITKGGKPLDRSNIWKMMKNLCSEARVDSAKVFPHNLRHLFAFTYYSIEKDIVRLASILGHSSIETTRIYTMSKGVDCIRSLSKLGLMQMASG